jgi:hypothetical protein
MTSFATKASALVAGVVLPLVLGIATARAATYDWTYTAPSPSLGGAFLTGSGTITTGASSDGGFVADGLTGKLDGSVITGLIAAGGFEGNDNIVFPTGSTVLSLDGLAFGDAAGDKVDIFSFFAQGSTDVTPGNNYGEFSTQGFGVGVFSLTAATAVPEPAGAAVLASSLLGLAMLRRRRNQA